MPSEKHLGPHTEGNPLLPFVLRIQVLQPLKQKNGHHCELVVWLQDDLFSGQKLF